MRRRTVTAARSLAPFTAAVSPRFSETVKLCQSADEQTIPRHRRSGHAHFIEGVHVQQTELGSRLEDESVAVLTQRENPAIRRPRRCREEGRLRADALLFVDLSAGARVMTRQESEIEQNIEIVAIEQRGRSIRS